MKENVLRKLQEKKGVSVLCEYCEDGDAYEDMDENETHYCNSSVDIYGSEEAFTREVEYTCPECKLRVDYSYDMGAVTIDIDIFDGWKYYDEYDEVEYDMTHPVCWKQAVVIKEESKC